jgi:hypothetical protein
MHAHDAEPTFDNDSTLIEHDDMGGQSQDLVELMTDIHHRNCQSIAQALEIGQHFFAARDIERCKRLIQKQ